MNKQIKFGNELRRRFAEIYDFSSWEKFVEFQGRYNGSVGDNLVADLEEMVETAAEFYMEKVSQCSTDAK